MGIDCFRAASSARARPLSPTHGKRRRAQLRRGIFRQSGEACGALLQIIQIAAPQRDSHSQTPTFESHNPQPATLEFGRGDCGSSTGPSPPAVTRSMGACVSSPHGGPTPDTRPRLPCSARPCPLHRRFHPARTAQLASLGRRRGGCTQLSGSFQTRPGYCNLLLCPVPSSPAACASPWLPLPLLRSIGLVIGPSRLSALHRAEPIFPT